MPRYSLGLLLGSLSLVFSLFDTLNEQQLVHLFGTASKSKAPHYWIEEPSKGFDKEGLYYAVNLDGTPHKFRLSKHDQLISPGFHAVIRNGYSEMPFDMDTQCIYRGKSVSHNDTFIALVGCGPKMRGLIVSKGEHYLIHPHFSDSPRSHVIQKRSLRTAHEGCAYNAKDDPYPEDRLMGSVLKGLSSRLAVMNEQQLVVELAVFVDDSLWTHFESLYKAQADAELQKFVLAVVNNIDAIYQHPSIEPKIRVKITRFEVMKIAPLEMNRQRNLNGDVDTLLDLFCKYQDRINPIMDSNPQHWDHALLFSGLDLYRGDQHSIAGYAVVKGMCSKKHSCTINEGLDFGSVFVVAHEMGHSLGMYHDGDNECDLRCCIMSPTVGRGKTSWSQCSVREYNLFVMRLGKEGRPENCLLDGSSPLGSPPLSIPAGQEFTLDAQCEFFHGECWKHELKDGQDITDVCVMVWCGNGEGVVRSAHPALEGTSCGEGKWCNDGKCEKANAGEVTKLNGGWSAWSDIGTTSCSSGCVSCSIAGQIRVRRSSRRCSKPYANNGGRDCVGDASRGIRCQDERCSGLTPDEFATQECTKQRNKGTASLMQLTGKGYQFDGDMCKVWCVLAGGRIRTTSNFPDGTPCGNDRYCVKGHCRPLMCGGRAVVESAEECPLRSLRDDVIDTRNTVFGNDKVLVKASKPQGRWSGWSSWSVCTATRCRQRGIRLRQRTCGGGVCSGLSRQRSSCFKVCNRSNTTILNQWRVRYAPHTATLPRRTNTARRAVPHSSSVVPHSSSVVPRAPQRTSASQLRYKPSALHRSTIKPRRFATNPSNRAERPRTAVVPRGTAVVPRGTVVVPRSTVVVPRSTVVVPRSTAASRVSIVRQRTTAPHRRNASLYPSGRTLQDVPTLTPRTRLRSTLQRQLPHDQQRPNKTRPRLSSPPRASTSRALPVLTPAWSAWHASRIGRNGVRGGYANTTAGYPRSIG